MMSDEVFLGKGDRGRTGAAREERKRGTGWWGEGGGRRIQTEPRCAPTWLGQG